MTVTASDGGFFMDENSVAYKFFKKNAFLGCAFKC